MPIVNSCTKNFFPRVLHLVLRLLFGQVCKKGWEFHFHKMLNSSFFLSCLALIWVSITVIKSLV